MQAEQQFDDYRISVQNKIVELYEASISELFESHDLEVKKQAYDDIECEETSMCIIGAGSSYLKLSVCLNAEKSVLKGTYPVSFSSKGDEKLTDWIGELSNQLMGKLKNKLISYECRVSMNIPTIVYGKNMGMVLPKKSFITPYTHTSKLGQINSMISIIAKPGVEKEFDFDAASKVGDNDTPEDGELMFF